MIEKGSEWSEPFTGSALPELFSDDSQLGRRAYAAHLAGLHLFARVAGGDLLKTLGVTNPNVESGADRARQAFKLDLCLANVADGADQITVIPFVSHLVVRKRFWRGPFLFAMNAQYIATPVISFGPLGSKQVNLKVGPRAHPNDGLIDITYGQLPFAQLPEALRRAKLGQDLAHPGLNVARRAEYLSERQYFGMFWADGRRVGRGKLLKLEVVSDALTLVV